MSGKIKMDPLAADLIVIGINIEEPTSHPLIIIFKSASLVCILAEFPHHWLAYYLIGQEVIISQSNECTGLDTDGQTQIVTIMLAEWHLCWIA